MQEGTKGKEIKKIPRRRVLAVFGKMLMYLAFFGGMMIIFYMVIAYAIVCLNSQQFYNPFSKVVRECIRCLYLQENFDVGEAIPDIIIAAASLLLAVAAMFQSHHDRSRSRALEFPHNYLKKVCVVSSVQEAFSIARGHFELSGANKLLLLSFQDGFPTYYSGVPYRLYVKLKDKVYGKAVESWQELEIVNYDTYNHLGEDSTGGYLLVLEIGRSTLADNDLLNRYGKRLHGNTDIKLNFILDIEWTNHLAQIKSFYRLFLRKEFELSRDTEKDFIFLNENVAVGSTEGCVYSITDARDCLAPFFGAKEKWKCRKTEADIKSRDRNQRKSKSILEKRKN